MAVEVDVGRRAERSSALTGSGHPAVWRADLEEEPLWVSVDSVSARLQLAAGERYVVRATDETVHGANPFGSSLAFMEWRQPGPAPARNR